MFKRIVKFNDGQYGIRRWSWSKWRYEYKDLTVTNSNYWFSHTSEFLRDCKGTLSEVLLMSKHSLGRTINNRKNTDIGTSLNKKEIERIRIINALKGE